MFVSGKSFIPFFCMYFNVLCTFIIIIFFFVFGTFIVNKFSYLSKCNYRNDYQQLLKNFIKKKKKNTSRLEKPLSVTDRIQNRNQIASTIHLPNNNVLLHLHLYMPLYYTISLICIQQKKRKSILNCIFFM